jgi:hypothetical protein
MGCCTGYVHFLAIRSGLADELRKAGTQHSRVSSVTDTAPSHLAFSKRIERIRNYLRYAVGRAMSQQGRVSRSDNSYRSL